MLYIVEDKAAGSLYIQICLYQWGYKRMFPDYIVIPVSWRDCASQIKTPIDGFT